jgi:chemotaxis protein MotB
MKNDQNILILKEKLKVKDREISKLQNFKQEWEGQVKIKIDEMKGVITEQKKVIDTNANEFPQEDQKLKKEEPKKDNNDSSLEFSSKFDKEKSKNKSLKKKNKEISASLKDSKKSIKKFNKERTILMKAYKKLNDSKKDEATKLREDFDSGKKNKDELKKELTLVKEKNLEIQKELEAQKKTKDPSSSEIEREKMESKNRVIDNLEGQIVNLSSSLEASREKTQIFLNERNDLQNILNDLENDLDLDSNQNLSTLVNEQIQSLKAKAELNKKKAESLEIAVGRLTSDANRKPKTIVKTITKDGENSEEGGAPAWMCTFADMVTLLMVFFVVFYSVSADNTAKMLSVIEGTEDKSIAIGVLEALEEISINNKLSDLVGLGPGKGKYEFQVEAQLKKDLEKAKIDGADVGRVGKKIIVNVPANNLFKPASADLTKQSISILNKLSQAFLKFPDYVINIYGHTDDLPISTVRFPSNWELSASRATAVLRLFADKGIDPLKMTATGRSDLIPLFDNNTEFGRSKNRRVEFVLEKEKK